MGEFQKKRVLLLKRIALCESRIEPDVKGDSEKVKAQKWQNRHELRIAQERLVLIEQKMKETSHA